VQYVLKGAIVRQRVSDSNTLVLSAGRIAVAVLNPLFTFR
jgi:hypothetical protein